MHVEVSALVEASPETVYEVYADYSNWPALFPTIRGVRLIRRDGAKVHLEVDHVEGRVVNELVLHPPEQIDLWEVKRRYDARFVSRFETAPRGTRLTVNGEVQLKGWARILRPFLGGYVRRLMCRLQLDPVKAEAERRMPRGPDRRRVHEDRPGRTHGLGGVGTRPDPVGQLGSGGTRRPRPSRPSATAPWDGTAPSGGSPAGAVAGAWARSGGGEGGSGRSRSVRAVARARAGAWQGSCAGPSRGGPGEGPRPHPLSVSGHFLRPARPGHAEVATELIMPELHTELGFWVVHPTGQYSNKCPQVEGHVLRLSARHAKLRREGYRKIQRS